MKAASKSKLEEQATAKAELSYSYWAARAAGEAPPPEPKKLTDEEASAQERQLAATQSVGASAWNAAGTFEERSISLDWVRQQLGELLAAVQHAHQGAEVAVTELASCSGEAHQWIVRGKKRAGFELNFEFKWRATCTDGAVVHGTAKVPHAAADELDELELQVTPDKAGAAGPAAGAAGGREDAASADAGADAGSAAQPASEEQRRQAQAAVSSMVGQVEEALQALLERMRQK